MFLPNLRDVEEPPYRKNNHCNGSMPTPPLTPPDPSTVPPRHIYPYPSQTCPLHRGHHHNNI
ncbi:hypothetical protein E2C01_066177 [Portunus trituberculatus]|uniref:Uncharacterized protein n=1 Tax=Portunus trituberculatus TaxID=210409 RepID=A0A5B7HRL4_PORTR|nr:hypothetical protein [Portunus trituberculatus]